MMYPFMTLSDKTEVVRSEAYDDNGVETVEVYFEQPVEGGFHSAECYLPRYEWKNIDGFTLDEITEYEEFLKSVAHIVIRFAREGGLIMLNIRYSAKYKGPGKLKIQYPGRRRSSAPRSATSSS